MSRSNNTELKNPARRFFEWNGDKGGFKYFDKSLGDKGQQVAVPLPFAFLVLDVMHCVRGFNDHAKCSYWSNEIRDFKTHRLTVRNKNGVQAEGAYKEVMAALRDAKYCQSVYIAYYEQKEGSDEKKLVIGNIQLMGAAVSEFIDFRKKFDIYKGAIVVKDFREATKGRTIYKIPNFTSIPVSEEADAIAKEMDEKELRPFLDAYIAKTQSAQAAGVPKEVEQTVNEEISNSKSEQQASNIRGALNSEPPITAEDYSEDDLPF